MHAAAKEGRDYTVECLVKKGADISIKDKNEVGQTMLANCGKIRSAEVEYQALNMSMSSTT